MWKRRALWLVLLILSLIGISFYGGTVSYGFLAGVVMVPVISWIYLSAVFFRFKVYQEIESRSVVCGQPVAYFFVLKNEDYFTFAGVSVRMYSDFSFVQGVQENVEYQLLPGEVVKSRTSLICRYRGEYEVGIREVEVTDFFRLFRLRYRIPGKIKAIVLPKLIKLSSLQSIGELNSVVQRETAAARQWPDIPVREYVAGDPLKQIHWKASARAQKLMVREQTGEEKQGVSVLLSTKRYGRKPEEFLPLENKMLEIALALCFFFAEKQIPIALYYGQGGLKGNTARTLGDFDELYGRTAEIVFAEGEKPAETARCAFEKMASGSIALFVVHEMEEEYIALSGRLRQSGTAAFFYVVADETPEAYLRLQEFSERIFTVAVEADLEEVL